MTAPTYTYALTNGNVANATEVTQNFTDILNGVTDGTKDLAINSMVMNGSYKATLQPYVNAYITGTFNVGGTKIGASSTTFVEVTDTAGNFSASTFTAPSAGRYMVSQIFNVATVSGVPTAIEILLYVNSAVVQNRFPRIAKVLNSFTTGIAANDSANATTVLNLAANDSMTVYVAVTAGTSVSFDGSQYSTLTIAKIA